MTTGGADFLGLRTEATLKLGALGGLAKDIRADFLGLRTEATLKLVEDGGEVEGEIISSVFGPRPH